MLKEVELIENDSKKKKIKKIKEKDERSDEGVTNFEKKMRDGRTLRKGMVREIKNKRD